MGKMSDFHIQYMENKDFYDQEAKNLTARDFMIKYKIGTFMYYKYFKLKGNNCFKNNVSDVDKYKKQIKRASQRQDENVIWFNKKLESIAERLGISKQEITKLTAKYTVSELESAKWENGKIVCEDIFVMKKPKDFSESMYSLNSSMV